MYGAYMFLYEAPVQYIGDVCAQLERREKNLHGDIFWHRPLSST
jgi:hypothetical protein